MNTVPPAALADSAHHVISDEELMYLVPTPKGEELVAPAWCQKLTRQLQLGEIQNLLKDTHPQHRPTVRAIPAVRER